MARKKNEKVTPEQVSIVPQETCPGDVWIEEVRQKVSGDELKAQLRQQRREQRLAEKGY